MTPSATYRLQLHGAFTFDDARRVAPYLRDLGISHVYCSPYLQAAPGSTHGYDVVGHNKLNDELGGAKGHRAFCEELGRQRLGQVLDIVPNHMAIGERSNRWWWDVLENGPSSRYAHYFDVEWEAPEAKLVNLMLLPILGDHYGRVLENGELRIVREEGNFMVQYHDTLVPLAPKSIPDFLSRAALLCECEEVDFLADTLRNLPAPTATDALSVARRHRDKEIVARRLAQLCRADPKIAAAVNRVLDELNSDYDALDQLLSSQNFRLAYWRTAGRDLSYRRFFDINTLVGLRMENESVFHDTHRLILQWLDAGVLDGVRIDHPDGLLAPQQYFERLRAAAPNAWIVAEKILEPGERLREHWPIQGTTGYDFLHKIDSLFIDPSGEQPLTATYSEFTGCSTDYHQLVRERKELVLRGTLGSDVNRLTAQFMGVCERHRRYRDFTRHHIHQALRVLIVNFPVYRTYVRAYTGEVHEDDRRYITDAIAESKRQRPDLPEDLFDFLQSVLLCEISGPVEAEFVMRFQQFTGPAMAKGVEDTTFYVFNRMSSLNEVGGDPGRFGMSLDEFHREMQHGARLWPAAMLATSTHDTKRSEDVRCRLHVLSEVPGEWTECVNAWRAMNDGFRTGDFPDRNMEYLFYQAIVGAWPIDADRLVKYMEKASREAKTHTSWTDADPAYDEALQKFVRAACENREFIASVERFVKRIIHPGRINSLTQSLVKLTAPGVPDIYQGTELWNLSLVDPDNRRPVDYELRQRLLNEVRNSTPEGILERIDEGLPKLWLLYSVLNRRRDHGMEGDYRPVAAKGSKAGHVIAFLRGDRTMTVAPRLVTALDDGWGDTVIPVPEGRWRNVLTGDTSEGGERSAEDLFRRFPVALLHKT